MYKRNLAVILGLAIIPIAAQAELYTMTTLSLGIDAAHVGMTKTFSLLPPFQNSYVGSQSYDAEAVAGIFVGKELDFSQIYKWQFGLSYYRNSSFQVDGYIYQFADPQFNNLTYQYSIASQRILLESKLLTTVHQNFHPYLSGSMGEAINKSYGYTETPVASYAVAMQPFANRTAHSLAYNLGMGLDMDVNQYLRVGAGYRFADLGHTGLGLSATQQTTNTLSYNHLYTHEVLLQLSYVMLD